MTDLQKTLEYLKSAGKSGVHSFVLGQKVGTWRIAARVNDLKKLGYSITSIKEKLNGTLGCRYFLNNVPNNNTIGYSNKNTIGSQIELLSASDPKMLSVRM